MKINKNCWGKPYITGESGDCDSPDGCPAGRTCSNCQHLFCEKCSILQFAEIPEHVGKERTDSYNQKCNYCKKMDVFHIWKAKQFKELNHVVNCGDIIYPLENWLYDYVRDWRFRASHDLKSGGELLISLGFVIEAIEKLPKDIPLTDEDAEKIKNVLREQKKWYTMPDWFMCWLRCFEPSNKDEF